MSGRVGTTVGMGLTELMLAEVDDLRVLSRCRW